MTGKVLAHRAHARLVQAQHQGMTQLGHRVRVAVEGAVADHCAVAVVQVEHRREAEIEPMRRKLG